MALVATPRFCLIEREPCGPSSRRPHGYTAQPPARPRRAVASGVALRGGNAAYRAPLAVSRASAGTRRLGIKTRWATAASHVRCLALPRRSQLT
jgi:hypothetical protein